MRCEIMLTEETILNKKLGCLDLVIITINLDQAGIEYRINKDGSLSVFNADMSLVYDVDLHKWKGYVNNVYIEGSFSIKNRYPEITLICDKYSKYGILSDFTG